jgi:hypothetical protein
MDILFVPHVVGIENPEYGSQHCQLLSLTPYYDARELHLHTDIKIDFPLPSFGVYFRYILEVLELAILSFF